MKDLSEIAREAAEHCNGVAIVMASGVVGVTAGRDKMNDYILHALEAAVGGVTAAAVEKLGQATLTDLRAELEQARKDTDRLDHIEENCTYKGGGNGGVFTFTTPLDTECFRAAIDAARQAAGPQ